MRTLVHFFEWSTGLNNESGKWYGFWSGFGGASVIGSGMFASTVAFLRHQNCGVHRCWRLGRHEYDMDGVRHRLCRKHHPAVDAKHLSADDFARHHAAQQ